MDVRMSNLQLWGINFILALQTLSPALDSVMKFFSFLGREDFFLVLLPLVYWCVDRGVGARFVFLLLLGDSFNHVLKLIFHAPRPYWIEPRVKAISSELSYGAPSGHAQNAIAVWPFLARAFHRSWGWAVAVALALLVSLSRLYLGVHFPHDIAIGWLIGLAWLIGFWWAEPRVTGWIKNQPSGRQHLAALLLPAAILLVMGAVSAAIAGTPDPPEWAEQAALAAPPAEGQAAIEPRNLESFFSRAGALYGASIGLSLMWRRWRFDAGGPLWKRTARFALGIAVVLALRLGLGAIFPEQPPALGYTLRFLRYALIGLWVGAFAPWLFLRWKLVEGIRE